ncbi:MULTISPECIES: signal peptidase II [unclassified Cyanobium]|uniref:signal peptidase II n=1 Tax=unclassified Cyanobium TaxID=2627006 RepID=UPI0020CE427F|nr:MULTISPECIES: signal peptidase II [unclassified Cyanobium]MCP9858311.1 signal peptidase II [Cyanobium sp. Cruz-8H5]MCP9865692.1 signal peptidase II [Cyanobium sp. Cruz-8D1]
MARPLRRRLGMLLLAALILLLDQVSKAWALDHLASGNIRPLLPGLLQLQRVSNTGAAFSLFSGASIQLGVISALVSLGLLVWILWRPPVGLWNGLALGLLLGGALGNGIDRWRYGAVVDFLEFLPIHFPIFNLADVAINLAVACFFIDLLRPHADRHP